MSDELTQPARSFLTLLAQQPGFWRRLARWHAAAGRAQPLAGLDSCGTAGGPAPCPPAQLLDALSPCLLAAAAAGAEPAGPASAAAEAILAHPEAWAAPRASACPHCAAAVSRAQQRLMRAVVSGPGGERGVCRAARLLPLIGAALMPTPRALGAPGLEEPAGVTRDAHWAEVRGWQQAPR